MMLSKINHMLSSRNSLEDLKLRDNRNTKFYYIRSIWFFVSPIIFLSLIIFSGVGIMRQDNHRHKIHEYLDVFSSVGMLIELILFIFVLFGVYKAITTSFKETFRMNNSIINRENRVYEIRDWILADFGTDSIFIERENVIRSWIGMYGNSLLFILLVLDIIKQLIGMVFLHLVYDVFAFNVLSFSIGAFFFDILFLTCMIMGICCYYSYFCFIENCRLCSKSKRYGRYEPV